MNDTVVVLWIYIMNAWMSILFMDHRRVLKLRCLTLDSKDWVDETFLSW